MRKRLLIISLCALPLFAGCDFLRRAAGRPTSADIEIKRARIEYAERRAKEVADSLERVEELRLQYVADSLAVMDSLASCGCLILSASETANIDVTSLSARYWIVAGTFRVPEYASRRENKLREAGFVTCRVSASNGLNVILISPNDKIRGIYEDYLRYVGTNMSTSDVWILDAAVGAADLK